MYTVQNSNYYRQHYQNLILYNLLSLYLDFNTYFKTYSIWTNISTN